MTVAAFGDSLGELLDSLGDPTRRAIFLAVRGAGEASSVAEIAQMFDVHPNVARHHLDLLVEAGYLRTKRAPSGPSGGRPRHLYEASGREVHVDLPPYGFELLARLLSQVLVRVSSSDVTELAYQVGLAHGEQLASAVDPDDATDPGVAAEAVADTMRGLGFSIDVGSPLVECAFQIIHCPFGKVALENPRVVCALDRGLVTGLMSRFRQPVEVAVTPHTRLDQPCTTVVTVPTRR